MSGARESHDEVRRERDMLRAEVERLAIEAREWDELHAELARARVDERRKVLAELRAPGALRAAADIIKAMGSRHPEMAIARAVVEAQTFLLAPEGVMPKISGRDGRIQNTVHNTPAPTAEGDARG